MYEGKTSPKAQKPTSKKSYKLVFFNYLKPGHIANVCRSITDANIGYRPNTRYVPRRFEGYYYTCNMYGNRSIECRYGENNPEPHMNPRPIGD